MKMIICDRYGLSSIGDKDLIVDEDLQYEEAIRFMQEEGQTSNNIVVKNPALFHWFDAPAKKHGWRIVVLHPVTELKKKLQRVEISSRLLEKPEWIIELRLIEKAEQNVIYPDEFFEAWVRRVLLGSVWAIDQNLTDSDIAQLFSWLTCHTEDTLHPYEKELARNQLRRWAEGIPERSGLFRWLEESPFLRARYIVWEQLLAQYPPARTAQWLQIDDIWYSLNLLPDRHESVPQIKQPIALPEGIAISLRSFLEEEWNVSPLSALSYLSSQIEPERAFLLNKLRSHLHQGIALEKEIYDKICQIGTFPDAALLSRQLIPLPNPSLISDSASIVELQEWLRDEYLPFYHSRALLHKVTETEPFVDQFTQWLKRNYASLLVNGIGAAYSQLSRLKQSLADGMPALLYVFDGLDYFCAQESLVPEFEKEGAYIQDGRIPYLAFLPTETFISKPTVVSGRMSSQLPPERPEASFYLKLLRTFVGLSDQEIRSATDQDSTLDELVQSSAKVYLYLDNKLDREYLHAALSPYVRWSKYAEHLKKQAAAIVEAARMVKDQYGYTLFINICSDHGYTELPTNAHVIEVGDRKNVKPRSAFRGESETFAGVDPALIWHLKPDLYGLHEEMIIPTGYACFGKRPKGATHGGCTPQEMAVPWLSITLRKLEIPKPPYFTLEGEIFRMRKENALSLTISNPNPSTIEIRDISLEGMDLSFTAPLRIEPFNALKINAFFDATVVSERMLDLKGSCEFGHAQGKTKADFSIRVQTKGAMVDLFDDEFEF